MATYQRISGFNIKSLATDPSNLVEGEIWFNSTSGTLKTAPLVAAAFASGTALPSVRWSTTGTGIKTAAFIFGGATGPAAPTFLNTTFEGDGTAWTAGGTNPLTRINQFGVGTQTATIGGGGYTEPGGNTAVANTYNGTSWTGITSTPYVTKGAGAAGTTTAALVYGSDVPGSDNQASNSWNGGSWIAEGTMSTSFQNGGSGGPTETTAFATGSIHPDPAASNRFETYNGTSWASGPALNTPMYQGRGFGSSTECLSIGGYNKITGVERFNGTAWATAPSLGTGRKQFASSNSDASGVASGWVGGGADGPSAVEEYTAAAVGAKTITTS